MGDFGSSRRARAATDTGDRSEINRDGGKILNEDSEFSCPSRRVGAGVVGPGVILFAYRPGDWY
jgi:hypothetical protein